MSQSLTQIYVHFVFSTKVRNPFLGDDRFRERMFAYLGETSTSLGCQILKVGGVEDHVHVLCRLGKVVCVADFIRDLKRASSRWAKETDGGVPNFAWQLGYGGFSISPGHIDALAEYIANQWKHHHPEGAPGETYQDEYRACVSSTVWKSTNATVGTNRAPAAHPLVTPKGLPIIAQGRRFGAPWGRAAGSLSTLSPDRVTL